MSAPLSRRGTPPKAETNQKGPHTAQGSEIKRPEGPQAFTHDDSVRFRRGSMLQFQAASLVVVK